jgi:hypothetical protein
VLEIIPGHRHKQYCNDACRQAAHRARLEKARLEQEERDRQARIQQERAVLIKQFGNLLPGTLDLLQSLQSQSLVSRIGQVIAAEQECARQDYVRERNEVIDNLLEMGEQLGFPMLRNDDFALDEGLPAWLAFCGDASLEWLCLARDVAYVKVHAVVARKRLSQLQPASVEEER